MDNFSFIKYEPRKLLSAFSRLWILFICGVITVLLSASLVITYKNYLLGKNTADLAVQQENLSARILQIDRANELLDERTGYGVDLYASNTILKKSLQNLFELVPNSITIDEIRFDRTSLIIKGVTPSKDVFNQLLASPLKSLFTTSHTSFFRTDNGWFSFVSTNKINNPEGYNE